MKTHKHVITKEDVDAGDASVKTPHGKVSLRQVAWAVTPGDIGREVWYQCDEQGKPNPRKVWLK